MTDNKHTQEPWHFDGWNGTVTGISGNVFSGTHAAVWAKDNDTLICPTGIAGLDDESVANAQRIVACVNACAGIPTDELEKFGPDFLSHYTAMKEVEAVVDERDSAKAMLNFIFTRGVTFYAQHPSYMPYAICYKQNNGERGTVVHDSFESAIKSAMERTI